MSPPNKPLQPIAAKDAAPVERQRWAHSRVGFARMVMCSLAALTMGCASTAPYDALLLGTYADSIGYMTVPEAQAVLTLTSRTDVKVSFGDDGWVQVREPKFGSPFTVWWFVPRTDPAYPTVVMMYQDVNRSSRFQRRIRCEATTERCEQFVRELREANERMLEAI